MLSSFDLRGTHADPSFLGHVHTYRATIIKDPPGAAVSQGILARSSHVITRRSFAASGSCSGAMALNARTQFSCLGLILFLMVILEQQRHQSVATTTDILTAGAYYQ